MSAAFCTEPRRRQTSVRRAVVALGSLAIVVAALATSPASPAPLTCGWTKTFKLPVFSDATHPAAIGTAAATAAADAWASGYSTNAITGAKQALMLRWNGSSWKVVATPDPTRDSVGWVAAKKGEAWAVGGSPSGALTMHWKGGKWVDVANPEARTTGSSLTDVAISSPDDVWAVGTARAARS